MCGKRGFYYIDEVIQGGALKKLDWQASQGRVSGLPRPRTLPIMCQSVLRDPALFALLLRIDLDRTSAIVRRVAPSAKGLFIKPTTNVSRVGLPRALP